MSDDPSQLDIAHVCTILNGFRDELRQRLDLFQDSLTLIEERSDELLTLLEGDEDDDEDSESVESEADPADEATAALAPPRASDPVLDDEALALVARLTVELGANVPIDSSPTSALRAAAAAVDRLKGGGDAEELDPETVDTSTLHDVVAQMRGELARRNTELRSARSFVERVAICIGASPPRTAGERDALIERVQRLDGIRHIGGKALDAIDGALDVAASSPAVLKAREAVSRMRVALDVIATAKEG